jgi:hypothetical protein
MSDEFSERCEERVSSASIRHNLNDDEEAVAHRGD